MLELGMRVKVLATAALDVYRGKCGIITHILPLQGNQIVYTIEFPLTFEIWGVALPKDKRVFFENELEPIPCESP